MAATCQRVFILNGVAHLPSLREEASTTVGNGLEVEEHAAIVQVVEGRLGGTIDRGEGHGTTSCALRNPDLDRGEVVAHVVSSNGDRHLRAVGSGEHGLQREAGVVDEVVARESDHVANGSILTRHLLDVRSRDNDLEVDSHRILRLGDEINLVGHLSGDRLGNVHQQGIVGDITGIENGLLVVEPNLVNTAEVIAHQTECGLRRCALYELAVGIVGVGSIVGAFHLRRHTADVVHGRCAVGQFKLVGLVLAGGEAHARQQHGSQTQGLEYIVRFHIVYILKVQ